ncbi:hypothetical protein Sjap_012579 [Stephania japonica]|uniref:Uncharacterized protein n=1 Tax=Stephania japonica TaxID=461633 RepID=A0AAP0NWX6_9MAGN
MCVLITARVDLTIIVGFRVVWSPCRVPDVTLSRVGPVVESLGFYALTTHSVKIDRFTRYLSIPEPRDFRVVWSPCRVPDVTLSRVGPVVESLGVRVCAPDEVIEGLGHSSPLNHTAGPSGLVESGGRCGGIGLLRDRCAEYYWSNILIPPHLSTRSDVADHFKGKFYQR